MVQRINRQFTFSLGGLLALLALAPSAHAAAFDSISKAMGTAWNAIGSVFSFNIAPGLQEGVLKFLIFILILRVVMNVLEKTGGKAFNDPKTAGIIGFVVAAVTVLFTPNVFIFSSIILLLVPIALAGLAWWYVFRGSSESSDAKSKTPPWLAALTLLALLTLLEFLNESVYVPGNIAVGNMYPFTSAVMNLLIVVTGIMFVWKLFAMIFAIGGKAGSISGTVNGIKDVLDTSLVDKVPSAPHNVDFELVHPDKIRITWGAPVSGETVTKYWIEHQYEGRGWSTIDKNRSAGDPHDVVVGAIGTSALDVSRRMQVRVRAKGRNSFGGWSAPGASNVKVPGPKVPNPGDQIIIDLRARIDQASAHLKSVGSIITSPPVQLARYDASRRLILNRIIHLSTDPNGPAIKVRHDAALAELATANAILTQARALRASIAPHLATMSPSDVIEVRRLSFLLTRFAIFYDAAHQLCTRAVLP